MFRADSTPSGAGQGLSQQRHGVVDAAARDAGYERGALTEAHV